MTLDNQIIFSAFMGAIAMAAIDLASQDWKAQAAANEEALCKDKSPEFKAMMVRYPTESHNVEWCAQIMRFGSKDFVPEFQSPLGPQKHETP